MLLALALSLRGWWGKVPGLLLVLKTCSPVRPIAKRLACRMAATAKRNGGATAQAVRLAFHIDEFDFPFDAQWTVVANRDFRRHLCSRMPGLSPRPGRGAQKKSGARIFLLVLRHPGIDFIRPGQDAALQVPQLFETRRLQEMDGVGRALSAAAMHHHFDGTVELVHAARQFPERN
jgi:hypothetical protein